jgi:hypothetical protein
VEAIPEEIVSFLDGNIGCVDQLEVLRLLGDEPAREWSAAELAREVQARPQALAADLAALSARGLLVTVPRGPELLYRHGPLSPRLQAVVGRLLELYRKRPVSLIKLVYSQAGARPCACIDGPGGGSA